MQECEGKQNRESQKQDSGTIVQGFFNKPRPGRSMRFGRAQVPGTALRADLGSSRIRVQARAELNVVTAAAEVTEERWPGCNSIALIAVPHDFTKEEFAGRLAGATTGATRNPRN